MSFRAKLLAAFALAVVLPLLLLAAMIPREMTRRFETQYSGRLRSMAQVIRTDLASENQRNRPRLAAVISELGKDIEARSALMLGFAAGGAGGNRQALLDYAGRAALRTGLDVLQIQNDSGRILSSAHFRNEYDQIDSAFIRAFRSLPDDGAVVRMRTASGSVVALARMDTANIGGRLLYVTGGVKLDSDYLRTRSGNNSELGISLFLDDSVAYAADPPGSDTASAGESRRRVIVARSDSITLPYIDATRMARVSNARVQLSHAAAQLEELIADARRWIFGTLIFATAAALVVAAWLSSRLSGPLTELANETARIDLDKPSGRFTMASRKDEIGMLASRLTAMMERIRASAARLRDAERRATMGELARQVNHDIKNGLTPIRNVMRHLHQIMRDQPSDLPAAFAERQPTLDSSIEYLDALARNYARLSPRLNAAPSDIRPVIEEVKRGAQTRGVNISVQLPPSSQLPPVLAEAAVIRRILENLVGNAIDALEGKQGSVGIGVTLEKGSATGNLPMVRLTISDSGRGMTEDELRRAFDDFHTTKPGGTGLGLSVVRRLVADISGILRIESEPGRGTQVMIFVPVAAGAARGMPGTGSEPAASPPSNKPAFK